MSASILCFITRNALYRLVPECATLNNSVISNYVHRPDIVDEVDGKGRTPLSYAMEHGHEEVVKHLLDAGAEIKIEELEALERPKWVALSKRDAMLQLVRDAQNARILKRLD